MIYTGRIDMSVHKAGRPSASPGLSPRANVAGGGGERFVRRGCFARGEAQYMFGVPQLPPLARGAEGDRLGSLKGGSSLPAFTSPNPSLARRGARSLTRKRNESRGSGFTLIEMLVVVAIVLIALTIVLPSATALWNQRKVADAENVIQGLLMTARAGSLQAGGADSGLLFFLDEDGTQEVVSIEADVEGRLECAQSPACLAAWEKVFRVTERRRQRIPAPMRAVPRYAVDEDMGVPNEYFSAAELANDSFATPIMGVNQAQRHRNYFTMIYSGDGRLLVRRDVLIRDDDLDDVAENGRGIGDRTGLRVGEGPPNVSNVKQYYAQDDKIKDIGPAGSDLAVPFLVSYNETGKLAAVNFPSVDALIVYDDSIFLGLGPAEEKREYLVREGLPFYVNRLTGAVVKGPRGETEQ